MEREQSLHKRLYIEFWKCQPNSVVIIISLAFISMSNILADQDLFKREAISQNSYGGNNTGGGDVQSHGMDVR